MGGGFYSSLRARRAWKPLTASLRPDNRRSLNALVTAQPVLAIKQRDITTRAIFFIRTLIVRGVVQSSNRSGRACTPDSRDAGPSVPTEWEREDEGSFSARRGTRPTKIRTGPALSVGPSSCPPFMAVRVLFPTARGVWRLRDNVRVRPLVDRRVPNVSSTTGEITNIS